MVVGRSNGRGVMMMRTSLLGACVVGGLLVMACSGNSRDGGFGEGGSSSGASSSGSFGNEDGGSGSNTTCFPDPKNYDIPGNNCDDDGDGKVDNPPSCDDGLALTGNAEDFARAIGICTKASEKGYGLVSAKFTRGYERNDSPKSEQHGILPKFGNVIKPREGASLGVLSTGYAREYDGNGKEPFGGVEDTGGLFPTLYGKDWYDFGGGASNGESNGSAPPGFPKAAAGCGQEDIVNDVISLKLEVKAPANVSGVKFDFNFYSGEWPAYICTPFNDGFIAFLTAKGFNGGKGDNMSFDKDNNPVSVNNGFFDRCTPNAEIGCASENNKATSTCPGGPAELAGTGFGIEGAWCGVYEGGSTGKSTNGGATGWLTSQAPIEPGETFTLELMIWDTGDAVLDSSVLVDGFSWVEGTVNTSTDRPPK
jgi:hypothetical protein